MGWRAVLVLLSIAGVARSQNCRGEEPKPRPCENVCDENGNCRIRAAMLLPKNTTFYASLPVVQPVFDLAIQSQAVQAAFPPWLKFEWMTYDVTDCDAAYAVISAIDAYNDCAHVFFGPACDFALASVARITKFLGNSGIPLITTGGFTFDFVTPKQTCDDEFYMLVRTSPLGFKDMAYFIIDVMRHYDWRQLLLINEPEAQVDVAGKSTCHLMMKTFANFLKIEDIIYTPWDTTSDGGLNHTENLKFYLGYKYTSKFDWKRTVLLYETSAFVEYVGVRGGHLLASTIHDFLIREAFHVYGRELQPHVPAAEALLKYVGYDYTSKWA
ncbi:unnamed protein product [Leptosia nina]|uniref:Receptor ligand binding region domain-containing protein n=1 Tax=Leptosia nina TaxID=320188 RepID=A0AAV1J7Q7_9NEOP